MKPENIVKVFSALKWVSCLGLLVGSVFFVKDITQKYLRKDSTFISYTKPAFRLKHPTFVLCFNPYIKKSMLKKFNLTYYEIQNLKLKNLSISYPDFYNQANYKLGYDFNISLGNLDQTKAKIDSVDFENDLINVEELYTLWSGICIKINQNEEIATYDENSIAILFNEDIKIEDLPKVHIFATSEQNSLGIVDAHWADGNVFTHKITPQILESYTFYFEQISYEFLKETSNCNDDYDSNVHCVAEK